MDFRLISGIRSKFKTKLVWKIPGQLSMYRNALGCGSDVSYFRERHFAPKYIIRQPDLVISPVKEVFVKGSSLAVIPVIFGVQLPIFGKILSRDCTNGVLVRQLYKCIGAKPKTTVKFKLNA